MISLSAATKIFVISGHTDMRKSFNGLYGIVAHQLNQDPTSGHVFVFCNRTRNRIKMLLWDGSGLWVCAKRLEQGSFHWPWKDTGEDSDDLNDQPNRDSFLLTHESLSLLLGGIDLSETHQRKWYRKVEGNKFGYDKKSLD